VAGDVVGAHVVEQTRMPLFRALREYIHTRPVEGRWYFHILAHDNNMYTNVIGPITHAVSSIANSKVLGKYFMSKVFDV